MRHLFTLFIGFSIVSISLQTSQAQTRGVGAGAIIIDDLNGHTVSLLAPLYHSPEWFAWALTSPPFKPLSWSVPVPPSNNAQAGFVYSGPLGGTTVPQIAYWLPPGQSSRSSDGNAGGTAGAWDYAGFGQLGVVSGNGSVGYLPVWLLGDTAIGASSLLEQGPSNGLLTTETLNIQQSASGQGLDHNSKFINFLDGSGWTRGSIKGRNEVDLLEDPAYDIYIGAALFYFVRVIIYAVGGGVSALTAADFFEAPISVTNALILASQVPGFVVSAVSNAAKAIEMSIDAGVQYTSSSGDYAEYLRRTDTSELLYPGDVVGVKNGMISKNTDGAQSIFSISSAPIVLGNEPPMEESADYNKVGFLGQVPVKVRGAVNPGDFIVASGLNDGFGAAIPEGKMTPQEFTQVVGRAWTTLEAGDVGFVKVAVGLSAKDMSEIASRQEAEIASVKSESEAQMASMNTRFQKLEQAMTETDPQRKQVLLAQAEQQTKSITPSQVPTQQSVPPAQSIVTKPVLTNTRSPQSPSLTTRTMSVEDYAKHFSVTPADLKSLSSLQHLQSYDQALQAMKKNIRKIASSAGTRQSKSDQIKEFLLHPVNDPDTKAAVLSCVMESIQSAKTMVKNTVNQTR